MAMPRHRLRELREAADKTQQEAADAIGVGYRTYCRWEQGGAVPRRGLRTKIAEAFKVDEIEVAQAFDEDIVPAGQSVPESLSLLAALEQGATAVWAWEPVTVHGLLQTAAYATAVERSGGMPPDKAAERVRGRVARQQVLAKEPDPLRLSVILDESALLRSTGGPRVMAGQLDHLADVSHAMPNVNLQVLPLSSGVHLGGWGMFSVLANGSGRPHLVCDSTAGGVRYHEGAHDIDMHQDLFDRLSESALPPDKTIDHIVAIRKELQL